MKLYVQMDCGNAAFEGDGREEIARLLRELADTIERQGPPGPRDGAFGRLSYRLRDQNGNPVAESWTRGRSTSLRD